MLKKLGLFVLALSVLTVFSAALFAQSPPPALTQADVDLYIKISNTPDIAEKTQLMQGAGDPVATGLNQGKIGATAAYLAQGLPESNIKEALGQSPMTAITDEELALLTGQKDALVAAFNASIPK